MTYENAERLTTINRQEKAALIWAIDDKIFKSIVALGEREQELIAKILSNK